MFARLLIFLAGIVAASNALALRRPAGIDICPSTSSLKSTFVQKFSRITAPTDDLTCSLCLDLVVLGEAYVECGEAQLGEVLDEECEKLNSVFFKTACLDLVNEVIKEFENDSDDDPDFICTKILKRPCVSDPKKRLI